MTGASDQGTAGESLDVFLARWQEGAPGRAAIAATLAALAQATVKIAALVRLGPLAGALGAETGGANSDGDAQKKLDVMANDAILQALQQAPVAWFASEEEDEILTLTPGGAAAVAADPLDGSSNIDSNTSIGTIFSVYPASAAGATASFFRPGAEQVAAGYAIYGPHTALVLTLGEGVVSFVLDPSGCYRRTDARIAIPATTREYAINASNYRYWREPVRAFVRSAAHRDALTSLGATDVVIVSTGRGWVSLRLEITDMPNHVVWLPLNSLGSEVHRRLGVTTGAVVHIEAGGFR